MKALLRKEFREILWLGTLGLIVFGLLLLPSYFTYKELMKNLAMWWQDTGNRQYVQPLMDSDLWRKVGFFCAIYAAILGCLQVLPERLRSLWEFLFHRPMTPTGIFFAKTIIGLGVYLVAAGLPLVWFIVWVLVPGNIVAPFEWAMLLPLLGSYLAGIPFYFAGMLTGLRQARWYGSRILGLGAPLLLSVSLFCTAWFWQALLIILLGAGLLGIAAWGSFCTNGFYRGQLASGKRALTLTLALGSVVVAFFVGVMLADLVGRLEPRPARAPWKSYRMTSDGTVLVVTESQDRPAQITDLEGKPAKDSRTGAPLTISESNLLSEGTVRAYAHIEKKRPRHRWFLEPGHGYRLWQTMPQTLWYYGGDRGRLVGYDMATGRFVGSLGPNGFAADAVGSGDMFTRTLDQTLLTETAIYSPDFQNRSVRQLFSTDAQDTIMAASNEQNRQGGNHTLIVTRKTVRLMTQDGTEVLKAPFQPGYPDYRHVELFALEPRGKYALWIKPSHEANIKSGWKLPTCVTWFDGGRKTAATELPPLPRSEVIPHDEEKVVSLLMSPTVIAVLPWFVGQLRSEDDWKTWRTFLFISLAFSVIVCIPVGYWLTRRYSLPRSAQLGWSVFLLLFGFPGLLALLSVEEWPARTSCPGCKKLRVVNLKLCEHCGAEFSPPDKKGIEIFDSADRAVPT